MINKIPSVSLIKSRIGKKRAAMLDDIAVEVGGDIVIDALAKYPYENETTIWVFAFNEDDTLASALSDLKDWIDGLEPRPESSNWA